MTSRDEAARDLFAAAAFLLARGYVSANEGNVSRRFGDRMLITPSQTPKESLRAEDLVEMDIETGEVLYAPEGKRPSSEAKLHLCCYRARADVFGVSHAHSPFATAFAVAGKPIETRAYPEMITLFGSIPLCRYGRPSTQAVCDEVPEALSKHDAFLLGNHGLVAVGESAAKSAERLDCAERVAGILFRARLLGGEAALPDGEVGDLHEIYRSQRR